MAGSLPTRWLMRQAMIELCVGSERGLVQHFLQIEGTASSDDPFISSAGRLVWSFIVAKALAGEVELTGHLDSGAETIIATGLLASSHPNFQKQTLTTDGGTYLGVLVRPMTHKVDFKPDKPASTKPGPEPRHGDGFIQEMIRLALLDGFDTRKQLEIHMKQWCSQVRGDDRPDDRTIERWIARYCPAHISAK